MRKAYVSWRRPTRSELKAGKDFYGTIYFLHAPDGQLYRWENDKEKWMGVNYGGNGCGMKMMDIPNALLLKASHIVNAGQWK